MLLFSILILVLLCIGGEHVIRTASRYDKFS